jgi:hypothetical protein
MVKYTSLGEERWSRRPRDEWRDERRIAEIRDEWQYQSGCHASKSICAGYTRDSRGGHTRDTA